MTGEERIMRTTERKRRPGPPGAPRLAALAVILPATILLPAAGPAFPTGGQRAGGAAAQPEVPERVEHAVEVEEDATVTIMNFAGQVEVHETDPGEERTLRIVGVKRLTEERPPEEAARLLERVDLGLTRHGRHYRIGPSPMRARAAGRRSREGAEGTRPDPNEEVPITEIRVPRLIPPVSVDLEVWLPDGASLVVRTFSASVTVAGLSSPQATFRLRSISGEVTVRGLEADAFHAETVSGSLSIRDLAARRTRLQTLSGGVRLGGAFRPSGWYDIQTHSGDVAVDLASVGGMAIEAATYTGRIESEVEVEGEADPRYFHAHRGESGPHLAVNTFSGSVRLTGGPESARQR